jgi:hypothetical protein
LQCRHPLAIKKKPKSKREFVCAKKSRKTTKEKAIEKDNKKNGNRVK